MSSSSSSSQQQTMTTTDLPSAALDQLQWVRIVPKVSLTSSSASSSSTVDHPLWWPCLLFNEYEDFQEFFEDELAIIHDVSDDGDALAFLAYPSTTSKKQNEVALETRRLILSRIFANMLQRRPVMVARLLGRSIQDYIEIVNLSEDVDEETIARIIEMLESYQATDYMPFTALSSEERLRQMNPEAFAVAVSNDNDSKDNTTTIIDDELYMNYMLALDLAATQRMGGMIAPNKTLRSDFRDIARAELAKLSPSIKKLSDMSLAVETTSDVTNNNNNDEIMKDDPKEEDSSYSDSDDSNSDDEENEDKVAVEDDTAAVAQKVAAVGEAKASESKSETEVLQETTVDDASATLPNEDFVAAENSPGALSLSSGTDTERAAACTPATASAATIDCSNDDGSDRQERNEEEPQEQNESEDDTMDSGMQEVIEEEPEEQNEEEDITMKSSSTLVTFTSEGSCTSPSSHVNEDEEAHPTPSPSSKSEEEEKDEDPAIFPGDTPEEVQNKLELKGWTIDWYGNIYLSPKVGFDDIKSNPYGKGKDYFLDKTSFHKFLNETYGWQENKKTTKSKATITPKKLSCRGNKGSTITTVTPLSSKQLPKRTRRMSGDDVESPRNKRNRFSFNSEEEEVFYQFKPLISKLRKRLGWVYKMGSGLKAFSYVLPDCKSENKGGKYLKDFFYEESEVIQYCVDNNYFKHRITLGLAD